MEEETRPYSTDERREEERRWSKEETDVEQGDVAAPELSAIAAVEAKDAETRPVTSKGPPPVPDGGLDAWLQIVGSWCILLASWGLVNTFGVYQTFYETQLLKDRTSSDISWIGSLQAALLLIIGLVSGPLYDAGYFKHLIISGLFLIVFGQFMTSLCTEYWQVILAQGLTIGIGMGLVFLPSAALLAQYWAKHRSLAIGIASSGSPIGGVIFPIIFSKLEPTIGFGWATRVIAFILLGVSIVPILVMHTRLPPPPKVRSLLDMTAFKDAPFMVFSAASFFSFLTLYVAFFYIQLYTEQHGIGSAQSAFYLVTYLNVGSFFGRLAPNAIADEVGALNVLIVCTTISAALCFAWLGIHNLPGLIVFAILYGIFSGGVVSLSPSVIVSLSPDMQRVGARMGMLFLAAGIAILVGTPIGGAVLGDATEPRWRGTIGYGAAGLLIGSLGYIIARFLIWRKKGTLKA